MTISWGGVSGFAGGPVNVDRLTRHRVSSSVWKALQRERARFNPE